jgi:hypothetical protein
MSARRSVDLNVNDRRLFILNLTDLDFCDITVPFKESHSTAFTMQLTISTQNQIRRQVGQLPV